MALAEELSRMTGVYEPVRKGQSNPSDNGEFDHEQIDISKSITTHSPNRGCFLNKTVIGSSGYQ